MKKTFTLLLSSLFSLSLFAFDGSRLSISTVSSNMDLKIEVDGSMIILQENCITLTNLSEGSHDVKIYREKQRNAFGFGRRDIIYNNAVYLKRGFHFDITINRFGKALVDEHRIDGNDDWYNENEDGDDSDNSYDNHGMRSSGYDNVMSRLEFDNVKIAMRKEWAENNRLISAKNIMDKNNFTTQQVKELMSIFTFENNKLEIAKYAYCQTVDKENYYQVNDALTFNDSKDELARFIRESR